MGSDDEIERMVEACRAEATLAVRLYNDPHGPRAVEGFIVHMHIAWLYLLQAGLRQVGVEVRYRDNTNPARFVVVDGEPKTWELARCVEERWTEVRHPVRRNIEFFIALRNRIEHRHFGTEPALAVALAGYSQAMLLNFENELVSAFGAKRSLAHVLRFPVFVGTFTEAGEMTLSGLRNQLPDFLRTFLSEFHHGVDEEGASDSRLELRLRVVLEQVNRDPEALAIQFSRWDDLTEDEKQLVEELGRRGQAIVRERNRPVVGSGLLLPRQAEQQVAARLLYQFNSHHFLSSWKRKKIRPPRGAKNPERTDERYCLYDELSGGYGYTRAWVEWLVRSCSTEEGFQEVTGRAPKPRSSR